MTAIALDATSTPRHARDTSIPFSAALSTALRVNANLPAIACGESVLTYAELDHRSAGLAQFLHQRGVRAGDTVALMLPRSVDLIVAMVAMARGGITYAPVDMASPAARIDAMMSVLAPAATLAGRHGVPAGCRPDLMGLQFSMADPGALLHCNNPPESRGFVELQPMCVMFTSGSTGAPKGVCVPPAGVLRLTVGADFADFRPAARWAFLSSPAFDASHLEIWAPLLNGGTCVVYEGDVSSLESIGKFFRSQRVTDAWLTAGLFNAIVDTDIGALGVLSQLLIGGERLSATHVAAMLAAHPGVRLINGYGPTENTTFTLCHTIRPEDTGAEGGIPIGRPIRGTDILIDGESGPGSDGELLAGGEGVALGYLNAPDLSAERFVHIDGRRYYRTGDRVRRRQDGAILFVGRIDRQVKLQGHRVEIDEVERVLGECPGVGQAAVLLRGDSSHSNHLVAAYGGREGTLPAMEDVADFLRARLMPAAVPRAFVPLAQVPLNLNGKIDRAALERLLDERWRRNPEQGRPPTALETALAGIWTRLLQHPGIDANAHFLRCGGTSMLALLVAAAIRRELGREFSAIDVIRYPVLHEQAARIAQAPLAVAALEEADEAAPALLTLQQESLLAMGGLDDSGNALHVHVALRFECQPDWDAIRAAFDALVQRHPMLRVAAWHNGERARARLMQQLPVGWWVDQGTLAELPLDMQWPAALLETINRPIDTAVSGPMRVDTWTRPAGGGLLVWTIHHFAVDEASLDRALEELQRLGKGEVLPPVYGSPFSFLPLERAWIDSVAVREVAHSLAGALGQVKPPFDQLRRMGHEVPFEPSPQSQSALAEACTRWGCTPFAPLMTAYALAVQDVFGPAFSRVLTPFSRRTEPALMEPIGLLLDLRFIEAGARRGELLAQQLARVHQATVDAQRPSLQPFDNVVEATAKLSRAAAVCLNAFAFTWRLDPSRPVELAGAAARLLRVPQQGARFGVTLHAAWVDGRLAVTIEAVDQAFQSGDVPRLFEAFERRLEQVCAVVAWDSATIGAPAPGPQAVPMTETRRASLAAVWKRWVNDSAAEPTESSNFLNLGGSSLAALRMGSQIRHDLGLVLDVASFLARPTFGQLCRLMADTDKDAALRQQIPDLATVGRPDARRIVLLIPGLGGYALGLFQVATELHRQLGDDLAVGIVDLAAIVERAEPGSVLDAVETRIHDIALALGVDRLVGLAGFSLGGLHALSLAQQLGLGERLPICLLDTYAPIPGAGSLRRRIEAKLTRMFFVSAPPQAHGNGPDAAPAEVAELRPRGAESKARWAALCEQLDRRRFAVPGAKVQLIQAEHAQFNAALLWRRDTNGFRRRDYSAFSVYRVPAGHLDLPRNAAGLTAHLMAANLRTAD